MATNPKTPHNADNDIAQWAEPYIFGDYPWLDQQQHQAALDALNDAVITTDHYAKLINKGDILDSEKKSITKHTLRQRRNDLADFLMTMYNHRLVDESHFNDGAIHADRLSILNAITTQHWLKVLRQWEQETNPSTSTNRKPVSKWYGDTRSDQFIIRVQHTANDQQHPPEVLTLTAYLAPTFRSETNPGTKAGSAIVPWPF